MPPYDRQFIGRAFIPFKLSDFSVFSTPNSDNLSWNTLLSDNNPNLYRY